MTSPLLRTGPATAPILDQKGKPVLGRGWDFVFAALILGSAMAARMALDPIWGNRMPFFLFLIAVLAICHVAGTAASIVSVVVGFLMGNYFFVTPRYNFAIGNPVDALEAGSYLIICGTVLFFSWRTRQAIAVEKAARTALQQYATVIESSDDAIIGKSLDGRILTWSAGARKLYGYAEEEVLGKSISMLVPEERKNEWAPVLNRVAQGEDVRHFETIRRRKGGGLVDVSITFSPVRNRYGQTMAISVVERDMTQPKQDERERECLVTRLQEEIAERKEAQRALQQSQQLTLRQERLAAVGRLSAGLAHEFNNILTIIQGHAYLLLDDRGLSRDSVESVHHIIGGVERTSALVKQMLAFSCKQVMQRQSVELKETLSSIAGVLGRLLGEHVVLKFDVAAQLPPIKADPDMLQQILTNLVVNARDAVSQGGQIIIRACEETLSIESLPDHPDGRAGRFVCLSVADTGKGIDSTAINHIFDPFFALAEKTQGAGLGLASVYGMVNQNGGWIEVTSHLGRGTAFKLFFPLAEMPPSAPVPPPSAPARSIPVRAETILAVDDEPALRELVRELLESQGYRVLEASNGPEALRVWEEHGPEVDLLLTDMTMPEGISGQDLAVRLRQLNPALPVLFSSGYSPDNFENIARDDFNFGYLSKPYVPAELMEAVRLALAGGTAPRPPHSPLG